MPKFVTYAVLVYQGGIANVFKVDRITPTTTKRNAYRLYQGDFRTAEAIAHGLGLAGAVVRTMACNQAGDIQDRDWTEQLSEQPFSDRFHPINRGAGAGSGKELVRL